MNPIIISSATRIICAPGALSKLGESAKSLEAARALIVTDRGIVRAGFAERAAVILQNAGIASATYDRVPENPTELDTAKAADAAREFGADLFVGIGGGSALDCAKGANFILTNGGRMQDYWGAEKASRPMLPMIAIPTTAGTGSEVQRYALISDSATHAKMACGDAKAAPRIALLDAELTRTLPARVTATSGIDAISHAVESYVTRKRNDVSIDYAMRGWRLQASAYETVLKDPNDLEARGSMLLGACYAGLAIEHSMLGAAHSCANPLTARHGTVHGIAVALMLPGVIRFNAPAAGAWYMELLDAIGITVRNPAVAAEALAREIERLRGAAGLPETLAAAGVVSPEIPALAREAAAQWTAKFNPREIAQKDFEALFQGAA